MMPLIFVVDSVIERSSLLELTLQQAGYQVEVFATAHAIDAAEQVPPALVILAVDLRDRNGVSIYDRIREHATLSRIPLVLLANSKADQYRTIASSGTDICLSFPLAPEELVGTVETALRRNGGQSGGADIVIDPFAMKISVSGRLIPTTTLEFRLLDYLARHPMKVFTRDELLDAVWGDLRFVSPRSVDACVRRLREKIESESASPRLLVTIRGIGYKLEASPTWAGGACPCAICQTARGRGKASAPAYAARSRGNLGPSVSYRHV